MKRIFLTLGILLFVGGTYHIGQNYTLVTLNDNQISQINTGLQSSVIKDITGSNEANESQLIFRVGSFALLKR